MALSDPPVQTVHKARLNIAAGGSTTISVPSVAAGNLLVILMAWFDGDAGEAITVSDDKGNSWQTPTVAGTASGAANQSHVGIRYAMNVAAGTTVLTITPSNTGSGATTDFEADVLEISGAPTSGALDKDLEATGTSASMAIDWGALAQATELLLMIGSHTGTDTALTEDSGDGYTLISENEDNDLGQAYLSQRDVVATDSPPIANIALGASRDWFAVGISIKAAELPTPPMFRGS